MPDEVGPEVLYIKRSEVEAASKGLPAIYKNKDSGKIIHGFLPGTDREKPGEEIHWREMLEFWKSEEPKKEISFLPKDGEMMIVPISDVFLAGRKRRKK